MNANAYLIITQNVLDLGQNLLNIFLMRTLMKLIQ